jgi:hypothetical protein
MPGLHATRAPQPCGTGLEALNTPTEEKQVRAGIGPSSNVPMKAAIRTADLAFTRTDGEQRGLRKSAQNALAVGKDLSPQ